MAHLDSDGKTNVDLLRLLSKGFWETTQLSCLQQELAALTARRRTRLGWEIEFFAWLTKQRTAGRNAATSERGAKVHAL